MRVGANHSRHHKLAGEIDYLFVFARFKLQSALTDAAGRNTQIAPLNRRRCERHNGRRL
jgi:hypothetical protein